MARTGIAASETMCVGAEKMALLGRHCRAFAVGDPFFAGLHGCGFAFQGQCGRLLAVDRPRVKQIQIVLGYLGLRGNVSLIRQRRKWIFGSESGNVISCLHGAFDGSG